MAKLGAVGRLFKLLVRGVLVLLFLVGWGLALLAVHVVIVPAQTAESTSAEADGGIDWRVIVIPKNQLGISNTYVDTRDWTAADAAENEGLVGRMIEAGKGDALGHVVEQTVRSRLDELIGRRTQLLAGEPVLSE